MPNNAAPSIETGTVCQEDTQVELERLGAIRSPEGQSAMALAAAIDSGRALMALPAMTDALARRLDALRDATPKAKDTTDEFAARREARRRAAGF